MNRINNRLSPSRPEQLTTDFENAVDAHLKDLVELRATEMLEIEAFAEMLHVHPVHLSNTIKSQTDQSACGISQTKIIKVLKTLLSNLDAPIKTIALTLDFEPSQFTKWFRRFDGVTPSAYRKMHFLKLCHLPGFSG